MPESESLESSPCPCPPSLTAVAEETPSLPAVAEVFFIRFCLPPSLSLADFRNDFEYCSTSFAVTSRKHLLTAPGIKKTKSRS